MNQTPVDSQTEPEPTPEPFQSLMNQTEGDYTYNVYEDRTAEIIKYNDNDTDVTIPATLGGYPVTVIGSSLISKWFSENETLRSLTIPESVTKIGRFAFENCSNLDNVYTS